MLGEQCPLKAFLRTIINKDYKPLWFLLGMARMTKQKRLLHGVVERFSGFFDAQQFAAKAQEQDRKLGMATAYRFLKSLEDQGSIHSFVCDQRKIYSRSSKNHAHFTCEKCGAKNHLTLRKMDFLADLREGDVCHVQVDVVGVCKECRRKGGEK